MKHWSAEFHPRSLCSFGDSDGGEPSGDSGGQSDAGPSAPGDGFTGSFDPGGDPTGSTLSNSDFFGGGPTSSDSFPSTTGGPPSSADSFPSGSPTGDSFPTSTSGSDNFGSFPTSDSFPNAASFPTSGDPGSAPFAAGWGPAANTGLNNAAGPPGWATSDFGTYSTGGPTGTGFGPGAGPSVGGPNAYSSAPGISGFPGDFGAQPGAAPFGMPASQGDVGPQAGPGLPGGPSNVGNAEPGFMPAGPETTAPLQAPVSVPTDSRGQNFFGPPGQETASNFFGIGQAQAADRGTDAQATQMQSAPPASTESNAGLQGAFATVQAAANQIAQSDPALAQALNSFVSNYNASPNMVGPSMTGFEQAATPGAQQGFTGMSPAQASSQSFTGQPSAFNADSTQGKGDRGADTPSPTITTEDMRSTIDPMVTQQGYQQLAAEMNAQQAQQSQQQGRASETETTPAQTISNAFDTLAGRSPGLTQTDFDSRFGSLPPAVDVTPQAAGRDTFDSRFGSLPPAQQAQPDTFDSRFGGFQPQQDFGPNYGPQAPGLAPPGQLGPGMVMADPNVTPGQQQFGDPIPGAQFVSRSSEDTRSDPNAIIETIARSGPEITTGLIGPESRGVGREAAPLGLLSMYSGRPGSEAAPFGGGRTSASPFGPSQTSSRSDSGRPGLSITVGGRGDPGYYNTGGRGIAPGAKGAEYGGIYGPGVATGRPGTNTFGVSSREGAYGFYDPATGQYFR